MLKMIYPYRCTYKRDCKFLAWENRETGGDIFKKDIATGSLIVCGSIFELKATLDLKDYESKFCEEISEINFDKFWIYVRNIRNGKPSSTKVCSILLDGWNFIEDLIRTDGQESDLLRFRTPVLDKMYKKLFYGNNLPSVTPEGAIYNPIFRRKEISIFRQEIKWAWDKFFPKNKWGHK